MSQMKRILKVILVGRENGWRARIRRRVGDCVASATGSAETAPAQPFERVDVPPVPEAPAAPDGWVHLVRCDEVSDGEIIEVKAGQDLIALARVDGEWFALSNTCAHAGGPIGDGSLSAHTVTCPYHGWTYDVRTGQCGVDESVVLETFPVKVIDGAVYVGPEAQSGG